eukprot:3914351-Pyramimonas_sp.AAC.1
MNVIAARLHRLGITQPGHNKCLKWCIVILMHREQAHNKSWPSYQSIYITFRDFVSHVKNAASPWEKSNIVNYPGEPADLPVHVLTGSMR